ncbi:MAG: hypothetical protein GF398_10675 [Chitinivibrionales bacterium]|nr:hypothetical protein [Chitinivibrionales bacterium]
MVRYALDDVSDDMVLGQSIFGPTGELLLAAGYHVTERFRKRLRELGYNSVMISVEGTEDVIPETVISEHVQREMNVSLNKSASELKGIFYYRRQAKSKVRNLINDSKNMLNKFIMNSGITSALDRIIDEVFNQTSVVLNLSELDKASSSFFGHSINVTVIALCLGRKYRMTYDELKQLAIGAVNFDLGLSAVPKEIVEKEGELTDDEIEIYNQHTVYGHLMLSKNPAIPPTSSAVALQHHEYQNGSGFPRGISGDNRPPLKDFSRKSVIHRFAEIVAVSDAYDMLTNGRKFYCERQNVRDALRKLIEMSGNRLNSDIVKTLMSIVPLYPVGARIRIADAPVAQLAGYSGVVAKDNHKNLEEPFIILYETRNHQRVKPFMVDLSRHKGFKLELIT